MNKKGRIGLGVGIVFGLLMIMPSFVLADVTVSGGTESSMVDLEGINNGSVTPGSFTTQSGTTRNAYITDSGAVNTSDTAALLTNANGWNVNVSEFGSLTGSNYGVLFDDDGNNPHLNGTLTNYGSIYGGTHGAEMNYGTITNYGSLTAGIGSGAIFWSEGTGTARVTNSGTMSGGDNGLEFYNPSTGTMTAIATNNSGGTMSGYYNGIEFYSAGAGIATVTNTGSISGTDDGDGISLYSDGALTTRIQNNLGGTIYGYYDGIDFYSVGAGNAQVTNAGTITGDNGNGVYLFSEGAGTFTVNNTGTINSNDSLEHYEAVYIAGYDEDSLLGSGTGTATITNSGTIMANGSGIGLEYLDSATVTNNAGGDILSGWYNGIYTYEVGNVTINNSGRIISMDNSDGYPALYIGYGDTATVNNYTGGWIGADYGEGVYIEYMNTATVNNSGTIVSENSHGVYMYEVESATINNYAGGLIQADSDNSVYIQYAGTATVNNYGKINSDCERAVGIYSVETATINNYAGGLIQATEEEAIEIEDAETATVNNYGRIEGIDEAVYISDAETATVNNYAGATIVSYDSDAIHYYGSDYYGATVNVTNSGTIQSYGGGYDDDDDYDAIYIGYADTAKVTNNAGGSILSYYGNGITMEYISAPATAEVINSGLIQAYDDGVYIGYADTAKVTNNAGGTIQSYYGRGIALEYIGGSTTAEVINSGLIQAFGPHGDYGVGDAVYIGYADVAKVTNNSGGTIQSFNGYGVGIEYVYDTVNVTNSGTIQSYLSGVGIAMAQGAVTVTNNETGVIQGGYGLDDDDDMIGPPPSGVAIFGVGTAEVNNEGTIQGIFAGVSAYGAMGMEAPVDDDDDIPGSITVNNSGMIQGYYLGVGAGYAEEVTVTNEAGGTIQQSGSMFDDDDDGYGIGIIEVGTATVENAGLISGYDDGVGISYADTADVTNKAGGIIQGVQNGVGIVNTEYATVMNSGNINGDYYGVFIRDVFSADVTNKNGGIINGDDFGVLIMGAEERTVTNEYGGTISGQVGIGTGVNGSTLIFNYGKVESTDGMGGRAIVVRGYDNQVTLGTGSEIIGNIVAVNSSSDNYMILDGEGAIHADQMRGFAYLDKTGTGTWVLTGDMDYDSYYSGHGINIEEGILAFADRNGSGGVYTNTLDVYEGASLAYVVTATGSTGALSTYDYADFNSGTVTVIPAAGTYAAVTVYPEVLRVGGTLANPWTQVVSTSAFLSPELLDDYEGDPIDQVYDLVLTRLSFTTATTPGTAALGAALDDMYDTATGDLRTLLDELLLVAPEDVEVALAEIGGASYPALQFLSFNGLGKYLGVLNNHIGSGGAFAGNNQSRGFAYGHGVQLAMAGGGNSMSDATPMLLAAAGNIAQTQIAAGNNWGFWIDGYASIGNRRSDEIISKYKQTLFGGMLGFDVRVAPNLFLGISGGISTTDLDFDDLRDNGKMDSYHGSIYLCYNGKPWYAEGVFTYAYNKYDMERFIGSEIANGDFKGNEFNGYAEVGYKIDAGGVIIRPLAAFQVDYLTQDGFTETGSSSNLVVDDQSIGSYQSFLGLNVSGPIKLGASAALIPELRLKWAHEFSNDDHLISARFAAAGSDYFTIESEALSRDTFIAGLGLNLKFNKTLAAYLQYDAELNNDFVNHTGLVGLRVEW